MWIDKLAIYKYDIDYNEGKRYEVNIDDVTKEVA